MALTANSVLAQSEEKTFTEPKFGITLRYPTDWSFISEKGEPNPQQDMENVKGLVGSSKISKRLP